MVVTSSSLSSGASIAAGSALVIPPTITRADLSPSRPNTRPIEGTPGINGYRFPSEVGKYYMKIDINTYDRNFLNGVSRGGFGGGGAIQTNTDTIVLPLPGNIVDNNTTAFSEDSMGDVGGAADAIVSAVGNAIAGPNSVIGGIAQTFTKNAIKVGYAASGIAPNKFMTVVLQGPQYKKHSFTWKLYPKTAAESIELNIIINLLKKSMRTKLSGGNFFFEFPKVFKLSFSPNENFLYAFKPAVMESISVNYTPSGSPNFYGKTGAPDGITLTMNFWELEYWLSEDAQSNGIGETMRRALQIAVDSLVPPFIRDIF